MFEWDFCYFVQNYKFYYTPQHSWGFTFKVNHKSSKLLLLFLCAYSYILLFRTALYFFNIKVGSKRVLNIRSPEIPISSSKFIYFVSTDSAKILKRNNVNPFIDLSVFIICFLMHINYN